MKDLYLKFDSYDNMEYWLLKAGFQKDEETPLHLDGVYLDVVGVISEQVGEGEDATYQQLQGYHANLRVLNDELDLSCLDVYIVEPKTPSRVWA